MPKDLSNMIKTSTLALLLLLTSAGLSAELVRLTPENWDQYAPAGKEVDAIYGDYVLRNDRIVAVIADPQPGRSINLLTFSGGGCLIDLTVRNAPSDQLTAFLPGGAEAGRGMSRRYNFDSAEIDITPDGRATFICHSPGGQDVPAVTVRYTLEAGWDWVLVETTYHNSGEQPLPVELSDKLQADRTFVGGTGGTGEAGGLGRLYWVYDKWWGQAYGIVPVDHAVAPFNDKKRRLYELSYTGAGSQEPTITLGPGDRYSLTRRLICAPDALRVRQAANRLADVEQQEIRFTVSDPDGPVAAGDIELTHNGKPYASGRTDEHGRLGFAVPPGSYAVRVNALGRPEQTLQLEVPAPASPAGMTERIVEMEPPGYVEAKITDDRGRPIPCKVQFIGRDGTPDPFFFPDSGEHAVHNCYYSHDGTFRQAIAPGNYDVIVSRGPEYDAIFTQIEVNRGSQTPLTGKLVRSVDTTGWISADFHSHSSPSGDNTSSQLGRVLNLLAEHVEFAPCTEHNRIDSYIPHLAALGVEHLMATASGIELTGTPLPLNHQNAFPLLHKPNTQDGGGPRTHPDPVVQIERLALWDEKSDKFVQQNHPNIVQLIWDKDLDGKADEAFKKMLPFMDAIEIHPPHTILEPPIIKDGVNTGQNRIHAWLQLLNQGIRVPGVVNTDAHYNFHGSGGLRNYIKSPTDDPAQVKTLDIVHESEKGHIVVTTGPFMEVKLRTADGQAIPGDEVRASDVMTLSVRVQCPNWFDIDRVQVLLNGRPDPKLNFTRAGALDRFTDTRVKFDQRITLTLAADTHIIVVAIGEHSTLGPVMGPNVGKMQPVAVSNPIYIDVDGDGFTPNGDTLDAPLPLPNEESHRAESNR